MDNEPPKRDKRSLIFGIIMVLIGIYIIVTTLL